MEDFDTQAAQVFERLNITDPAIQEDIKKSCRTCGDFNQISPERYLHTIAGIIKTHGTEKAMAYIMPATGRHDTLTQYGINIRGRNPANEAGSRTDAGRNL